jgi:hypothetical protein
MAFDTWRSTGLCLCELTSASAWWLGDWLVYGERTYGKRYEEALRLLPLSYQTMRNYAWVARRFPASRRRDTLSFQHHAEVAALPEADRDLWLQRAERMRWTRKELRRQLAGVRNSLRPGSEPARVMRIEVSDEQHARWQRAAAAADQPLADWLSAVADAAAASVVGPQLWPSRTGSGSHNDQRLALAATNW